MGGTPSEIEPETVCGQSDRARALHEEILSTKYEILNKIQLSKFQTVYFCFINWDLQFVICLRISNFLI
jgi:hypothetical protein